MWRQMRSSPILSFLCFKESCSRACPIAVTSSTYWSSDQKIICIICCWIALGSRDPWPISTPQIRQKIIKPNQSQPFNAQPMTGLPQCDVGKSSAVQCLARKPPRTLRREKENICTHLGSFWMLSMDGDLAKVPSGGRVGPDLLYGDSTEGQYCSCR